MRIPDTLMRNYFELLTDVPDDEIASLTDPKTCNPRDSKEKLAKTIVTQYHTAGAADKAAEEFRRVHSSGGKGLPDDVPEITVPPEMIADGKIVPLDLIMACRFEKSRSEGRRIVAERGIRLNGEVVEDALTPIAIKTGDILQRGRRRFVRLVLR
jgi:tyrosyl-tRNA synthetase